MEPISAETIQETIKAGRIVEARTLLTIADGALSEEEWSALDLEVIRLHREGEALVARAEAKESEGKTEEAKVLYESVLLFATDFPGIDYHIKQMNESLMLTNAVKRRSQRHRQSVPVAPPTPPAKKPVSLLATSLALTLVAVLLGFFFFKNYSQKTITPKAMQEAPVRLASVPRTSPPPTPAAQVPADINQEPPVPTGPIHQQKGNALPVAPSQPVQSEEMLKLPELADVPLEARIDQNKGELYTVHPGDSLSWIALRQFCNRGIWKEIYQRNREQISDPDILRPGMVLHLDGIATHCPPRP